MTGLEVEALLSGVHAGRQERVEFADVAIVASAPAVLALERTDLLWDQARELYYLQHSVRSGQRLAQQLQRAARWELSSPDGVMRGRGQGAASYQIAEKGSEGIWTRHVWSDAVNARLLVLVKSPHDRGLLFDEPPRGLGGGAVGSSQEAREPGKTVHAELGTNIAQMDEHWLLPGLPWYFALLDAVKYRVGGDQKALEESRAILKAMAAWPTWLHPWFRADDLRSYYPVGLARE